MRSFIKLAVFFVSIFLILLFSFPATSADSVVVLTAEPAGESEVGQKITFTATTDSIDGSTYRFWFRRAETNNWRELSHQDGVVEVTPQTGQHGNYVIGVRAFYYGQMIGEATIDHTVIGLDPSVSLTASPPGQSMAGETVTFTASATGIANPHYRFWLQRTGTNAWIEMSPDFDTLSATPTERQAGEYLIGVRVWEAGQGGSWLAEDSITHEIVADSITDSGIIPAIALKEFARELYDELEKPGGNPEETVRDLLEALDVYQGPLFSPADIEQLIEMGVPIFLEDHAQAITRAYQNEMLVTFDSFIETMAEWGVYNKTAGRPPITASHLNLHFRPLLSKENYTVGETIPALILHMGHERASRRVTLRNTVWGDNYLDPLQFSLLTYMIFLSGDRAAQGIAYGASEIVSNELRSIGYLDNLAPPVTILSNENIEISSIDWRGHLNKAYNLKKWATGKATDFAGKITGVPMTKTDAIKAVICASVMLHSHILTLEVDDHLLNRRWPDNPPASEPYKTMMTAKLVFDFVPYNIDSAIILAEACGSPIPPSGPVSGKPAIWSINGELPAHGVLSVQNETFNQEGISKALYDTFDEKVPHYLHNPGYRSNAHGVVSVKTKDILPFKWRNLEWIVQQLSDTVMGSNRLTVNYYEYPNLEVSFVSNQNYNDDGDTYSGRFRARFPLEMYDSSVQNQDDQGSVMYSGTGPVNYDQGSITRIDYETLNYQNINGQMSIYFEADSNSPGIYMNFGFPQPPMAMATLQLEGSDAPPFTVPIALGVFSLTMPHHDHGYVDPVPVFADHWRTNRGSSTVATNSYILGTTEGDALTDVKVELHIR